MVMKLVVSALVMAVAMSAATVVEEQGDVVRGGGSTPIIGMPGGDDFCTAAAPCAESVGDCDQDDECIGDLGCGYDNCLAMNGPGLYVASQDCCEPSRNGHLSFCLTTPCNAGEGDCDSDAQCAPGLGCGFDNCRAMNPSTADTFNPVADCCEPLRPGHETYCATASPPCGVGDGMCSSNAQCAPGLTCQDCAPGTKCCKCIAPGVTTSATSVGAFVHMLHATPQPIAGLEGVPDSFFGGESRGRIAPVLAGTHIDLHCCGPDPCTFYTVVYHCPPCSNTLNGGLPHELLATGWQAGSCSPTISGHNTVAYYKQFPAGSSQRLTLASDALFLYTFGKVAVAGDADWCPSRSFKPRGPHAPRVCVECPLLD